MKDKIIQLVKSPFIKNVTVMATGTAAAQAISMALSPIITRLYGPEAFGIMGTFTAMINIIGPIAALTYPIAIVLPKNDQDARGIIRLSLSITVLISILSFVLLIFFKRQIIEIFNLEKIAVFLYLIPLVIIFSGLMEVVEQWLVRTKQFVITARVTFIHSLVLNGSKVAIGLFNPIASVLVALSAFGNGFKALLLFIFAKKSDYKVDKQLKEEKKSMKDLAVKYYDFPTYRAPEVFISAVSNSLPILMLTAFFGPVSAGFYTIGRTVLSLPSQLIGKSVGDVFYPRIAEAKNNKENVTELIKKATIALAGLGILPYGIVVLFGPFLFGTVFGEEWTTAGEYARWIALMSFLNFTNRPSVRALPVLNAQRFHLIYTIIMLTGRLVALAVGYYIFSSDLIAIALFGLFGAILYFGLIIFTLKISRRQDMNRIG